VQRHHRIGHGRQQDITDMAAFSLVLRMGFAREAKGEDLTCDVPLIVAPAGLRSCGLRIASAPGPVVSPREVQSRPQAHGDVLTAISDGIVALLKEFYGRGPTRAKSYYEDDLVVCLLRGGFSRVEQTLLEGGRGSAVIQQRMEFQELMRERFAAVIERATGRRVIGFMSGNQQDPDIMSEVFILAPTDLVEDHEIPGSSSVGLGG
jgi:uncharacterized protein YbcI